MGRFRIDHPELDVEALEERVRAAIERKRGTRFSDEDLARLRATRLQPRLRREDLPRGFLRELSRVRSTLPEIPPAPGASPSRAADATSEPSPPVEPVAIGAALFDTGSSGIRGRVVGLLRRLFRPFFRTVLNLEHAFEQLRNETVARVARLEESDDRLAQRLELSYDRLKDELDARIDRTGDWSGSHLSELTGALERRHERELQLLHNLVFELTHARLEIAELRDRLYETRQELALAREREGALEGMVLADRQPRGARDEAASGHARDDRG